jgi:RNA polymerase sigma factor (sigma-70 family)
MGPSTELVRAEDARLDDPCVPGVGRDWARSIELHQHRVVMSLVAAGLGLDRARDLAHEAWARIIEKDRKGALPTVKLPGLVIAQARFLALDERRRERVRRQVAVSDDEAEDGLVDGRPDPEQRLLTRQQARQALEAVAASSATAQRLFRLLFADPALPHAEAAERLGLSVQRVRHVLCELRKRVREALEGGGG